jgi:hypothetical protein
MLIFLCRRLSGKEKEKPSLRPLRLCGERFFISMFVTVQIPRWFEAELR